jgi:ribokinase
VKLAVVGHVEWVDFLVARRLPAPGEIMHVDAAHEWPGGGGAMVAYALKSLTGSCAFFCALGDDARAARTAELLRDAAGLELHAAAHPGREQRRVVTYLTTANGERTITVLGPRLVPRGDDPIDWDALAGFDGAFFTAGDAGAVRAARGARVLAATSRAREPLVAAGVELDVLIGSASDPGEAIDDELLAATRPRYVVQTEGERGGRWRGPDGTTGRWEAVPLPGAPVDAYGCGDAFAAALMAGLAAGRSMDEACAVGARVGAALLCQRAPAVGDLAPLW